MSLNPARILPMFVKHMFQKLIVQIIAALLMLPQVLALLLSVLSLTIAAVLCAQLLLVSAPTLLVSVVSQTKLVVLKLSSDALGTTFKNVLTVLLIALLVLVMLTSARMFLPLKVLALLIPNPLHVPPLQAQPTVELPSNVLITLPLKLNAILPTSLVLQFLSKLPAMLNQVATGLVSMDVPLLVVDLHSLKILLLPSLCLFSLS